MVVSVITFFFIIASLSILYWENKKAELFGSIILLLCLFTLVQTLEQYLYLRPTHNTPRNDRPNHTTNFIEKSANYDSFSFNYSNMTIHTNSEQFYYIGGNSNYYFLLDKSQDSTMIIPKSECSNIKGTPMSISKILKKFS